MNIRVVLVFYKITKRQENAVSKNPNYSLINVNMEMFVGGGGNFCVFTMLIVSIRKGQ